MDGRTGGRTDGQTDGWRDGWKDGQTERRTDGWSRDSRKQLFSQSDQVCNIWRHGTSWGMFTWTAWEPTSGLLQEGSLSRFSWTISYESLEEAFLGQGFHGSSRTIHEVQIMRSFLVKKCSSFLWSEAQQFILVVLDHLTPCAVFYTIYSWIPL